MDAPKGYSGFQKLTADDRANMCDIAWFLKGFASVRGNEDNPFLGCHHETLRRVIMSIADKINAEIGDGQG